jgi:hypothetical protein
MKNIIIFLFLSTMLIAPCFKRDYLILGTIITFLGLLLLTSGCAALLYSPLL